MSVLVVGSAALDTVETPHGKRDNALGGSAIFFSMAASYFTNVNMVAVVGDDFPMNDIQFLNQRGVDLEGLTVESGKTFRWGGRYHLDMNFRDTLFTHLNVFETFNPQIPSAYSKSDYVFLANIQPELQLRVLDQVQNPKLVVLDTMNYWIELTLNDLKRVLQRIDILIINDSETMQLGESRNLLIAAENVRKMGPDTLVIKKGEHGAFLVNSNGYFFAPAYPLKNVIDPTGAGDTFAGGFVGYIAKTRKHDYETYRRAIVYGSVLASYCVEGFSIEKTRDITPDLIETRFQEFRQLTHF